jgi:hypothetical protein
MLSYGQKRHQLGEALSRIGLTQWLDLGVGNETREIVESAKSAIESYGNVYVVYFVFDIPNPLFLNTESHPIQRIYRYADNMRYIGKSSLRGIYQRIRDHILSGKAKESSHWAVALCEDENHAFVAECLMIRRFIPLKNLDGGHVSRVLKTCRT